MLEVKLKLSAQTQSELERMAKECGMSPGKLVETIIEGFVQGDGKVYSAAWPEGPGIRLLHDWPKFSNQVFRVPQEELK